MLALVTRSIEEKKEGKRKVDTQCIAYIFQQNLSGKNMLLLQPPYYLQVKHCKHIIRKISSLI